MMRPARVSSSTCRLSLPLVLFALMFCPCPGAAAGSDPQPGFSDSTDFLSGVLNELVPEDRGPKNPDPTKADSAFKLLDLLVPDDPIDGSNPTLLQREPTKFSADIVGGLRAMDCETLKAAEENQSEHMGLLLAVRTLAPAPSLCALFDYRAVPAHRRRSAMPTRT